ncbi:MAG: hypothetical protein HN348_32200, partial [Proteobacteria bacterium]|nr:hypothetical protein [Pseudomonadota bacterium]
IRDISRSIPVVRVDWDMFRDADEMARIIQEEYLRGSFLRHVQWRPTKG